MPESKKTKNNINIDGVVNNSKVINLKNLSKKEN